MCSGERLKLLNCVAEHIRFERKKANMSMECLAELANVSLQTIKDIEYAKRACQIDTLVSIATALDVTADYLFGNLECQNIDETADFGIIWLQLNEKQKQFLTQVAKSMVVLL